MARNTGVCKNKRCQQPISEHGKANEIRYCDEHYKLFIEKKKRDLERRVCKIADRTISIRKIIKIEKLIRSGTVREEINRRKIHKAWISGSIKRKSEFGDILQSREWKNTQELLKRKDIICEKKHFMLYVQQVCCLYFLKLMVSREYLKKNNSYKKHMEYVRGDIDPVVTIKLEVAFSLNPHSSTSINSDDIILVPRKIRRMVTLEKSLLKKKIKSTAFQLGKSEYETKDLSSNKNKINKSINKNRGIYQKIKQENTKEEVRSFMQAMRSEFKRNYNNDFRKYPPLLHIDIKNALPLFQLAQLEYMRVYKKQECYVFIEIKKALSIIRMHLEAYALLSFHALMSGKNTGREFINDTLSWIENKSKKEHFINNIINNIQDKFEVIFKIKLTNHNEFSKLYNSFFSENVTDVNPHGNEIKSIRKEVVKNNFKK